MIETIAALEQSALRITFPPAYRGCWLLFGKHWRGTQTVQEQERPQPARAIWDGRGELHGDRSNIRLLSVAPVSNSEGRKHAYRSEPTDVQRLPYGSQQRRATTIPTG